MKLNNKGFAISSIMYIILVFAIILIALTLAIFSSRKLILDKQRDEALHEIYKTKYKNGDVVYFDVEKGVGCKVEEYNITNSNTGYNGFSNKVSTTDTTLTDKLETQNSCLKFYVFNDNGGDRVNLLLDHNTTATIEWITQLDYNDDTSWNNNIMNNKGPLTLLKQLEIDTKDWKGTLTPLKYTIDQTKSTSKSNYTIDYSNYKARIISAREITRITKNLSWDENVQSTLYFFDTNVSSASETCTNGNTSGCKYGWLYDRTSISCANYGCLNNSDVSTNGYWTSTSRASDTIGAWFVKNEGLIHDNRVYYDALYGIRPVIVVLRENLL